VSVPGRCCPICEPGEFPGKTDIPAVVQTESEKGNASNTSASDQLPVYMSIFVLLVIVLIFAFTGAMCWFYRKSFKHCSCPMSSPTPPLMVSEAQTPNNVLVIDRELKEQQHHQQQQQQNCNFNNTNRCYLESELEQNKCLLTGIVKNNSLRDPTYTPHASIAMKRLSSPALIANGKI
jgi:hypothetical protein